MFVFRPELHGRRRGAHFEDRSLNVYNSRDSRTKRTRLKIAQFYIITNMKLKRFRNFCSNSVVTRDFFEMAFGRIQF